jgi:hypothetical protein
MEAAQRHSLGGRRENFQIQPETVGRRLHRAWLSVECGCTAVRGQCSHIIYSVDIYSCHEYHLSTVKSFIRIIHVNCHSDCNTSGRGRRRVKPDTSELHRKLQSSVLPRCQTGSPTCTSYCGARALRDGRSLCASSMSRHTSCGRRGASA